MENVRIIFFDIGDTLVCEDDAMRMRFAAQAATDEAKALGITAQMMYDDVAQAAKSFQPLYRTMLKKYGFTESVPYTGEYERLHDGAIELLEALSKKYELGVIANQGDGLADRLKNWGIYKYFKVIVSSWDFQIMKPDLRLFEAALGQPGYSASQAAMIGDRLDNDVFPAKKLGMKTVWIRQGFGGMQTPRGSEYEPDETIDSLKELYNIF